VIDWLQEPCKSWGRSTRYILSSTNKFGDPEGYPSADTIQKARQGMLSLGTGGMPDRHFREVRLNGSLEIARAMAAEPRMPIILTAHMYAQYVIEGPAHQKLPGLSRYLGTVITVAEYWRNVDRAHYWLAGRLPVPGQRAGAPDSHADA
jgi:hypothetical protein